MAEQELDDDQRQPIMSGEFGDEAEAYRKAKCCDCGEPMLMSEHVNFVLTKRKATWKYPRSGNALTDWGPEALAVVCDGFVPKKGKPFKAKYAVELADGDWKYHEIATLEKLPPEPTYHIQLVAANIRGTASELLITCLVCGRASTNPNDIEQKYCGKCHKFHRDMMRERDGD